jgi:hypothetical protein
MQDDGSMPNKNSNRRRVLVFDGEINVTDYTIEINAPDLGAAKSWIQDLNMLRSFAQRYRGAKWLKITIEGKLFLPKMQLHPYPHKRPGL